MVVIDFIYFEMFRQTLGNKSSDHSTERSVAKPDHSTEQSAVTPRHSTEGSVATPRYSIEDSAATPQVSQQSSATSTPHSTRSVSPATKASTTPTLESDFSMKQAQPKTRKKTTKTWLMLSETQTSDLWSRTKNNKMNLIGVSIL